MLDGVGEYNGVGFVEISKIFATQDDVSLTRSHLREYMYTENVSSLVLLLLSIGDNLFEYRVDAARSTR